MCKCMHLSILVPLVPSGLDDACKLRSTFNHLFRYYKNSHKYITGYLTIHSTYL